MTSSSDELLSPDWMDKKFFEQILQKNENDLKLEVTSIDIKPATKPGDNYASIMLRVRVDYRTKSGDEKSKSMVVKVRPFNDGDKKEFLKDTPIFDVEMKMYSKVVPEMERLLQNAGDNTKFSGQMLYCSKEPSDVLVFEDLCARGYAVPVERDLDLETSKLVYERIGKWHACSYYMVNQDLVDLSEFSVNFFNGALGNNPLAFVEQNFISMKKSLMKIPEMQQYETKLENYMNNIKKNGLETYKPNTGAGAFNVLNHGDLYTKNLMTKVDEDGKVIDILLVDYQCPNFGSPGIDLAYSMYNVPVHDARDKHRDEMIHLYYESFAATLKTIGYLGKVPTMLDLQMEILKSGFVEVYTGLALMPYRAVDFSKINPDEILKPDFAEKVYTLPEVLPLVEKIFLHCIRKGYIY